MLYFVATPIGNLKDISQRAKEVLSSVDYIACEDTRRTLNLLNAYEIKKPLVAYHKFNERTAGEKLIEDLKQGKNIALVTDAGMPVISDPGNILTGMLIENGLEYTVVPGACAFVSALVLGGLDASKFCFLGFLPDKKGEKIKFLEKYKKLDLTLVFYSAPHDLNKNLQAMYEVFGERKAVTVREITKLHEERQEFKLSADIDIDARGEYVVLVEGFSGEENDLNLLSEEEHYKHYINLGYDKKEAIKIVAKERGVSKSSLYKYTIDA